MGEDVPHCLGHSWDMTLRDWLAKLECWNMTSLWYFPLDILQNVQGSWVKFEAIWKRPKCQLGAIRHIANNILLFWKLQKRRYTCTDNKQYGATYWPVPKWCHSGLVFVRTVSAIERKRCICNVVSDWLRAFSLDLRWLKKVWTSRGCATSACSIMTVPKSQTRVLH